MRCLVAVKQVIDPYVHIRINAGQTAVETTNVKMAMNPFDEIAMEEAMRLKEAQKITEVIAVSIGPQTNQETLRQALARGADRAVLVATEHTFNPLSIAKILAKLTVEYQPQLVLLGKQAIDDDCNQTGQMLAGLLDWPQATFVSKLIINNNTIEAIREIDAGLETLQCILPAIVTTDLRLNEPRVLSLPNVMQAKRKPLEIIQLESLGLILSNKINSIKINPPQPRKPGVKVNTVAELLDKLRTEAKVL